MRKLVLFCFVVAVLSYVLGAILAWRNLLIDWDEYLKIVAVVGGLASVIGLLGLVLSPIRDLNSEPTLKSKACFRCLFITKIISG